jgi:hypothetical protein
VPVLRAVVPAADWVPSTTVMLLPLIVMLEAVPVAPKVMFAAV